MLSPCSLNCESILLATQNREQSFRMPSNLDMLPPELLLEMAQHISPSTRESLRLASEHLQNRLPGVPRSYFKTAPRCEQIAWSRFLNEGGSTGLGKRQCILCHAVLSRDFFRGDVSICKWHDGWFMSTSLPSFLDEATKKRLLEVQSRHPVKWIAFERQYCAHQKQIIGWHINKCCCNCNSCGHFEVICYVRVSGENDPPKSWELAQDNDGSLCVIESPFQNRKSPVVRHCHCVLRTDGPF